MMNPDRTPPIGRRLLRIDSLGRLLLKPIGPFGVVMGSGPEGDNVL